VVLLVIQLSGKNFSLYEFLKLSYSGIETFISKTSSIKELEELRAWSKDIRWLFRRESLKVNRIEDYIEFDKELEQKFQIKLEQLSKRGKNNLEN